MLTVFVVTVSDGYDWNPVEAVFATRQDAERWILARSGPLIGGAPEITEWPMGAPFVDWMGREIPTSVKEAYGGVV